MIKNPIDQTNLALAAVTACIVQALDEPQAGVRSRLEKNLEKMYYSLRDGPVDNSECLATLKWTADLLKVLS
jgi:hypothetical protein